MFRSNNQRDKLWYHPEDREEISLNGRNPFRVVATTGTIEEEKDVELTPEYVLQIIKLHQRKNKKWCYSYGDRFSKGSKGFETTIEAAEAALYRYGQQIFDRVKLNK